MGKLGWSRWSVGPPLKWHQHHSTGTLRVSSGTTGPSRGGPGDPREPPLAWLRAGGDRNCLGGHQPPQTTGHPRFQAGAGANGSQRDTVLAPSPVFPQIPAARGHRRSREEAPGARHTLNQPVWGKSSRIPTNPALWSRSAPTRSRRGAPSPDTERGHGDSTRRHRLPRAKCRRSGTRRGPERSTNR